MISRACGNPEHMNLIIYHDDDDFAYNSDDEHLHYCVSVLTSTVLSSLAMISSLCD